MNLIRLHCLLAALAVTAFAHGHGGDDHNAPEAVPMASAARLSFSGVGDTLELTIVSIEDHIHEGDAVPLLLYLAERDTNAPVDGATISLTLSGGTEDVAIAAEATGNPGVYRASAMLLPGTDYSVLAEVSGANVTDIIAVDDMVLPGEPEAPHDEEETGEHASPQPWLPVAGAALAALVIGLAVGRALPRGERKAGTK